LKPYYIAAAIDTLITWGIVCHGSKTCFLGSTSVIFEGLNAYKKPSQDLHCSIYDAYNGYEATLLEVQWSVTNQYDRAGAIKTGELSATLAAVRETFDACLALVTLTDLQEVK
jgi:hypothetical protein